MTVIVAGKSGLEATLRYPVLVMESAERLLRRPRDFEIYEAFENRVAGGGSTEGAFAEVADALHVSVGQVAESCFLVQQLTRSIKTAAPLPPTAEDYERATSGEREDDTKEIVLNLRHAIDQLAQGATESAAIWERTPRL